MEPKQEQENTNTLHANPGVSTPENGEQMQSTSEKASVSAEEANTSMPAPEMAAAPVADKLDAVDMNPIEERAGSQDKKYMVIAAIIAVIVIILALLYMWGSSINNQNMETEMGDVAVEVVPEAPVPPVAPVSSVPVADTAPATLETDDIELPELSAIDADMAALEAEMEAALQEEPVL